MLKKYVRHSKYDPLVEEVDLIEANPQYAQRHQNGRETTVSIQHLAPAPIVPPDETPHEIPDVNHSETESPSDVCPITKPSLVNGSPTIVNNNNNNDCPPPPPELRRSSRIRNAPDKLNL